MSRFCISVDVEDDLPGIIRRGTVGLDQGLPRLLDLLEQLSLKADFFFLSSILGDYGDMVARIVKDGHGIGNHGYDHDFLCAKPIDDQRREIQKSTQLVEDTCGRQPLAFRAPKFSVNNTTLRLLDEAGYAVDSSVLPGRYAYRLRVRRIFDHRGVSQEPYRPFGATSHSSDGLLEVPVTSNPLRPGAPLGLGALNTFGVSRMTEVSRSLSVNPVTFLVHPWELVDLGGHHRNLPRGYARACSDDIGPLRDFLLDAKQTFALSTLSDVAAGVARNGR